MRLLITGGIGFIGSNLTRYLLQRDNYEILVLDNLTYAANIDLLSHFQKHQNFNFLKTDICNSKNLQKAFKEFQPESVMHLAAESHVDRSISQPLEFINTNVIGTFQLLQNTLEFYKKLKVPERKRFRFIHVSTDEVYGDLGNKEPPSMENDAYRPSSPYSASKASSDFLVQAWNRTYNFPGIITHCTNNFGPYQNQEKLIPSTISKIINNEILPIYGNGKQKRDWLYVIDHVKALEEILKKGRLHESYNIGGNNQIENLVIVEKIISLIANKMSLEEKKLKKLVKFVEDRPGHDFRYGLNCNKIKNDLNWEPMQSFEESLETTVDWYLKFLKKGKHKSKEHF